MLALDGEENTARFASRLVMEMLLGCLVDRTWHSVDFLLNHESAMQAEQQQEITTHERDEALAYFSARSVGLVQPPA